ncbi:MAG: tripartite tricarboxylate transporter substrate binding protein [Xanthobacteraceae bacterium]|nr:tripartite tricarboxylate transporter substrate binding protein [Xanthobacteraceae bacterium]
MTRSLIAGIVSAAAMFFASPTAAQDSYPSRPVRLVVGFGAGGPTDIPARFIADKLGNLLGQRIIVENKTGAAGMLATRDVLAQPADGYNLLLCTHFESINTVLYKNPGFKLSDIAPVSLIAKYYYGLALSNAVPANTVEELMAYAKTRPGEVSYGTLGAGSAQEIMARQFERLAGISMNRIPFRTGSQVMPDLIAGRVHFYVSPTIAVVPPHQAKQLKIIGVTSPARLNGLPDVPTLKEKGIDYVRYGFLGICAREGTPPAILNQLNRHIVSIVATPDYRKLIEEGGSLPEASTPAELGQVIAQTLDDVAATIREFGLQQE